MSLPANATANTQTAPQPYLGLIEGFYGRRYSEDERSYLCDFLASHGYSFYIYSPKADPHLRDRWQEALLSDHDYVAYLQRMSAQAHEQHLDYGIALSPLNLTADLEHLQDLAIQRVKELCTITHCEIFALLFDDMVKDSEQIGALQNRIISAIEKELPDFVQHFIICPSYYTDDPVLDKLFGKRPEHYFTDLTANLPERVEIFWTGERVLSNDITPEYLEHITQLLGRKPFIWDNYPVNDGKNISSFLYLKKFNGRRNLSGHITGHAVNPMVQPRLSTLAACTLPLIYQGKSNEEINAAHLKQAKALFGKAFAMFLKADNLRLFTEVGLKNMTINDRARLIELSHIDNTPALAEIEDFLNGSLRFDQDIIAGTHKLSEA